MKLVKKVCIRWNKSFAYAIGLLTTDGSLSIDGRHINFTSKDKELVELFKKCLKLSNSVTKKARSKETEKKYFQIQFGDINFYKFLLKIGLMPNKSKIVEELKIPDKYFFDFLRGHFDGDGTFYSYWDPRWKSSFMFYTVFISASPRHIGWLRDKNYGLLGIKGHVTKDGKKISCHLKYAKRESLILLEKLYSSKNDMCLSRKRLKIYRALGINNKNAQKRPGGEIGRLAGLRGLCRKACGFKSHPGHQKETQSSKLSAKSGSASGGKCQNLFFNPTQLVHS